MFQEEDGADESEVAGQKDEDGAIEQGEVDFLVLVDSVDPVAEFEDTEHEEDPDQADDSRDDHDGGGKALVGILALEDCDDLD